MFCFKRDSGHGWWDPILAVLCIALPTTASLFAVGIVHLRQNTQIPPDQKLPGLFQDTTFVILLSQVIPNFLTIFYEVMKLCWDDTSTFRKQPFLYTALVLAAGLFMSAPITYAASDRHKVQTQVNAAILNFGATMIIIFAGLLGIVAAGRKKYGGL